ncbi:MAG: nucleotidyl transferase AbiEii/AbiGii toxin family protein [Chloroflexi bacterium]|nr:nucleotidyl transferase AbiEii/AbiGii toxin family protein [Chloroflexota bacterium]
MASSLSILTRLQRDFLSAFFARPAAKVFFLTGGTALAEYYLRHRYSEDIDLFTLDQEAFRAMTNDLPTIAAELSCGLTPGTEATDFRSIRLQRGTEPVAKIDLVRDAGPQFGDRQSFGDVIVDSEFNIAVNKVTALFGRAAPKDFVDLYFLLKKGYGLDELMRLAKEKDLGFTEFYFAGMLREVSRVRALPRMIQPLTPEELDAFFQPLARQLMLKLKPSE